MRKLNATKATNYRFTEDNMTNNVVVLNNLGDVERVLGQETVARPVFFTTDGTDLIPAEKHKGIIVGNKIVAVQKKSYNLITNRDLAMPILEEISKTSHKWEIDSRHSFVSDTKMRLSIKFPEMSFTPADGLPITMALNITNSYDSTERISMAWGLLRLVCTNGMSVYEALKQASAKHTLNFDVKTLSASILESYEAIPMIQERINLLNQETFSVTDIVRDEVEASFGKRAVAYLDIENAKNPLTNSWEYYNLLTYYVSHYIHIKQRGLYQARASQLFGI